jgi:predicted ribosomally synthesized peptide with SipW-like signal peptide
MRRAILAGMLILGALSGYVQGPTAAFFSDVATSTANTFSAGTIDITHNGGSTLLTLSAMKPGDKVTAALQITNSGTLALNYTIASTVSDADGLGLGGQLKLVVKAGGTCTEGAFESDGTPLYGTFATPQPLGNVSGALTIIAGRSLASGSETLCFQGSLPSAAANSLQGATTTASLAISAAQT